MTGEKNIKAILRKNNQRETLMKRFPWVQKFSLMRVGFWEKVRNSDPRTFIFLAVAILAAIFLASKFMVKIKENKANNDGGISVMQAGVGDLNNGKIDEAEKKFTQALQKDGSNLEAVYNLAIVKYNKKNYDEAIADLNRIIKSEPKNAKAYNILGNINRDLKNNDEAMKNYRQAIEADPKFSTPYTNFAIMFINENKKDEAKRIVAEGLKNIPDSPELKNLQEMLNR